MQPNYKFCAALSVGRDELLACNKFELSHRQCYTVNVVLFWNDFVCESCLVWFWMNGYKMDTKDACVYIAGYRRGYGLLWFWE